MYVLYKIKLLLSRYFICYHYSILKHARRRNVLAPKHPGAIPAAPNRRRQNGRPKRSVPLLKKVEKKQTKKTDIYKQKSVI